MKQLQEAGVPEAQAETYVRRLEEATDEPTRVLVTRDYLAQKLALLRAQLCRVLALGTGGAVAIAEAL